MKKSIEKVFPHPTRHSMVGDGFRVYNMIPGAGISQQRITPFLMLDFGAAFDFSPSDHERGVDVHPHKLLSGEPIIASRGPFVMNTEEEIHEAVKEFQSGKFGVLT
ncbi:MAG: pirin-like C-terminal cupin domain-containing protein [Chitinophagaceae bacterium]